MRRSQIIFLVGVVIGAAGMFGIMSSRQSTWSIAFNQTINGEISLAVKPSGKIEFGPAFSADKSLQALLEGLRSLRDTPKVDCRETGYRMRFGNDFKDGVIR